MELADPGSHAEAHRVKERQDDKQVISGASTFRPATAVGKMPRVAPALSTFTRLTKPIVAMRRCENRPPVECGMDSLGGQHHLYDRSLHTDAHRPRGAPAQAHHGPGQC